MTTAAERAAERDAERAAAYEAHVEALLAAMPPLTNSQRARVVDLLAPMPVAVDSSTQHDDLRAAS
ncbi:hypothetical protein [Pseudonocardia oceani]|uniref:Uncharacterized protein n=1 Tax=Pseudonocardia oceani TaxID=2792013 RepID=A0ABS6UH38_9PSEU|nr:hypothetical protein [Pseudonocardia oceani]MBW0090521.1 hypothetical protein [Pseudonocardia oceani]MBW0124366.1 hypothetical protein [Pseudonocardia oceani]MBW0131231.1 hypothetical protein [Pseudonocardia oceani]MBW0132602.1 hypothetical protein [Pseudonocardia oceani]